MGGPIPNFASRNRPCTAWASTCAAEWRSTLSPSGLDSGTGSTCTSSSGTQERSRKDPDGSRTTTTALGPASFSPAARTASAHVVPAGTPTSAGATAGYETDTDNSFDTHGDYRGRPSGLGRGYDPGAARFRRHHVG